MPIICDLRKMPGPISVKRIKESDMCFPNLVQGDTPTAKSGSILVSKVVDAKSTPFFISEVVDDHDSPILPGLPDDVSKLCLALVPRTNFPAMGAVSKRWRSFIKSKEFITVRKLAGMLEEWLYIMTVDDEGKESHWEVLDCFGRKHHQLLPMPGPVKAGFGVVVLNGKLMVIAGYSVVDGTGFVSSDVYQYDSCLNRFIFSDFSFPQLVLKHFYCSNSLITCLNWAIQISTFCDQMMLEDASYA